MALHHYGKDLSRGAAGSFAFTAEPDVHLSTYCTKDSSNRVTGRRIVLTKTRRGETGWSNAFELTPLPVFKDADGVELWSAYVTPLGSSGVGEGAEPGRPPSQAFSTLKRAFESAESACGQLAPLQKDGPMQKLVKRQAVKDEFNRLYPGRADAQRKAFTRGVDEAEKTGFLSSDDDWLWRSAA
jgi:hypothetical protein